jgi:glutathione S-transferase
MRLLSAAPSPFGRKVMIAASVKGVMDRVTVEMVDTSVPENARLRAENPLAKIPVLILDDRTQIYDSAVICEYLDSLTPAPRLFPASGPERWRTLTLGALADGMLEAALLLVYEKRFRPEDKWVASWMDRQQSKIDAALALLEQAPPAWSGAPGYGHITLACALGYLDFRHEGRWRARHAKLVSWLDDFARAVPAYATTAPPA